MRITVSIAVFGLGPALLAVVMAALLLRRKGDRLRNSGEARRAGIIVAAATLAMALVTIGVLISGR